MAMEVETLRRDLDSAEEWLHDARRCSDELRPMDEDKEKSADVRGVEEELKRQAASTPQRV